MTTLDDVALEAALRDLGAELAVPDRRALNGRVDPARLARLRIEQRDAGVARPTRPWAWLAPRRGRRIGRGVAFALVAALAVAAVAGAIGLGLPGIRIVPAPTGSPIATGDGSGARSDSPGPSSATPLPSPTIANPLGSNLGLGELIEIGDMAAAVDIPIVLPRAPGVGAPATAWLRDGRLTMVWAASRSLPAMAEPGVGLVLGEFRGTLDEGYFEKIVSEGTTVTPVTVGEGRGYWIAGQPHEIIYVDGQGNPVFDSRRSVGDTLLWARRDVTYRLESGLGRAATIALAETIR